ncbi:hypothetical protein BU23DRAFT_473000, partial [Bimuria novae-zelandiae CBS 107.79]
SLPKTFRQAIEVCRQMNVSYIWIDSLCIFRDKDDLEDWNAQSSLMGKIYSSVLFNIAATRASDSTVGLQFQRNTLARVAFTIKFSDLVRNSNNMDGDGQFVWHVNLDLLNKRAWVVQEHFLSRRIMHFTSVGVCWECFRGKCIIQLGWNPELYDSWSHLLAYYTMCSLTFESDKLVALNGISELLAQRTWDYFFCGLWKQHLIPQL